MARPNVFSVDTTLYHPAEGARVFPAGETDPGPAWSENKGGDRSEKSTVAAATKDLIEANDRADALGQRLDAQAHDLGVMAKERDAANDKVAGLEQAAIDAGKAKEAAEDAARDYMKERDAARADLDTANQKVTALEGKLQDAEATASRVIGELEAAQQAAADASGRVQELETDLANAKAEISKVDGDGDGRAGGSKPKAADKA